MSFRHEIIVVDVIIVIVIVVVTTYLVVVVVILLQTEYVYQMWFIQCFQHPVETGNQCCCDNTGIHQRLAAAAAGLTDYSRTDGVAAGERRQLTSRIPPEDQLRGLRKHAIHRPHPSEDMHVLRSRAEDCFSWHTFALFTVRSIP